MNKDQSEHKFIKVFSTPKPGEIALIKSILEGQKIPYYIKGENFGTIYGAANGLSSMDIMVKEECSQDAKLLLSDFIKPNREPNSNKERREA